MRLISCENLVIGHDNIPVIQDLNFQVNQGDYLCILGENGTGKSTLMKTLLQLVPSLSGKLELDKSLLDTSQRPSKIGYLPQQSSHQRDFPASVEEIVLSGCLNKCGWRPFYNKDEKTRAMVNMERMGINHLARASYSTLSGGQQQRVLLARSLCATEKLLLLDEPVAGLDPKATRELYELIEELNQGEKITIIMITHDVGAAVKYGSHILHLSSRPLFFGTKEDYRSSDILKAFSTLEAHQ